MNPSTLTQLLEELTGAQREREQDHEIEHGGKKIRLPGRPDATEDMTPSEAIEVLKRKDEEENTLMDVKEIIEGYPLDVLHAFHETCKEEYGWVSTTGKSIETFFGTVDLKPELITIKTGPKPEDYIQAPVGQFHLPGVENPLTLDVGNRALRIVGEAKKREFGVIAHLAKCVRAKLKVASIYKGKALRLPQDSRGRVQMTRDPAFIDTSGIRPEELVLNHIESELVKRTLWAPIMKTEDCRKNQVPLNRGILLEGSYGTGKTMCAHVTSKIAVDNGWTFIFLEDVAGLKDALEFAREYAPAVVFAEDVDRVADKRDRAGNDLINTIDGVLSKDSEVITVLTTNFVEKLDKAMLRPGRLDSIISVLAPDRDTVPRLIRTYGRDLIKADEDLSEVAEVMAGQIPATIREVVERSKLSMIYDEEDHLTGSTLAVVAEGMKRHLELLAEPKEVPTLEHRLGSTLIEVMKKATREELQEDMNDIRSNL